MEKAVANSFEADMAHQNMEMPLTIRPSVPPARVKRDTNSVQIDIDVGEINKQCICMKHCLYRVRNIPGESVLYSTTNLTYLAKKIYFIEICVSRIFQYDRTGNVHIFIWNLYLDLYY